MKRATQRTELRIVGQERTSHMRGYAFACETGRMLLEVTPVHNGGTNLWRIEAKGRAFVQGEETKRYETAATRVEALRTLAQAWRDSEPVHGIRMFDWTAVEALLVEVHAL